MTVDQVDFNNIIESEKTKEYLYNILSLRQQIYKCIRDFFEKNHYLEVETPIMVTSPGIDPYINAFSVEGNMYLAPSPELQMKRLLGMGLKNIFQFTRSFRKGEQGKLHNPEFSLLEWYHNDVNYTFLIDEVETLIREIIECARRNKNFEPLHLKITPFPRYSVDELFKTYAGWTPSEDWDEDRFFRDFVEKVEPHIIKEPAVIIFDFPSPIASMARLKEDNNRICERFELYLNGLELANAFTELTDPIQQNLRFILAQRKRKEMGDDPYPIDYKFLNVLEEGLFPPCAGIALGLDRLLMALTGEKAIERVMAFPISLV